MRMVELYIQTVEERNRDDEREREKVEYVEERSCSLSIYLHQDTIQLCDLPILIEKDALHTYK